MNKKKLSIGFDRYIERAWLEQISKWVAQEKSRDELHNLVDDYLAPFINGATSLRKTKNVLFGVWVHSSDENEPFKKQAIHFLKNCSNDERLAIAGEAMPIYFKTGGIRETAVTDIIREYPIQAQDALQRRHYPRHL